MRKLPHLAALAGLSLVAACTCISSEIENTTSEPIFVNEVSQSGGRTYEDFGQLLMPGESVSIPVYGEGDIRARDMRGNTVFYAPMPEDEDSNFNVTSLRPQANAEPPGSPYTGPFGHDSPWSLDTCRDGKEVTIPLFGLLATAKNDSTRALVLNVDEYPGESIHDWKHGVFAAPGQTVQIFENVTEEPYLRAFDQEGRLVYMERLAMTERPTAVIPRQLPLEVPRPVAPYDNDCLGIGWLLDTGDAGTLTVAAVMLGVLAVGGLAALTITIRFFWGFYFGNRSG